MDEFEAFAFLHKQPPRAWSFEVDVRTFKESGDVTIRLARLCGSGFERNDR